MIDVVDMVLVVVVVVVVVVVWILDLFYRIVVMVMAVTVVIVTIVSHWNYGLFIILELPLCAFGKAFAALGRDDQVNMYSYMSISACTAVCATAASSVSIVARLSAGPHVHSKMCVQGRAYPG